MSKIKIQKILEKNGFTKPNEKDFLEERINWMLINKAIKEALETVINKCAEKDKVNKQSILQVKQMIDYE